MSRRMVLTAGLAAAGALVMVVSGPSGAQARTQAHARGISRFDHTFMVKAAQGGLAEVELGRLASERASNAQVKQFGHRMVEDHTRINEELKEAATSMSVSLPTMTDVRDKAMYARLSRLHGAAFDRAYISDMVKDHKADIADFRKASKARGAEVRGFASKALPTLEEHLRMAEQASAALSASARAGRGIKAHRTMPGKPAAHKR